jgi:hypothetical protein
MVKNTDRVYARRADDFRGILYTSPLIMRADRYELPVVLLRLPERTFLNEAIRKDIRSQY